MSAFKDDIANLRALMRQYEQAPNVREANAALREFNAAWRVFCNRYPSRFDIFDRAHLVRVHEQVLTAMEMAQ
jgi:hypothetical protein